MTRLRPIIVPPTRRLSEAHYSTIPGDAELRLNPGVRLAGGDLEIVGEIGRGGIAVVYRAIDRTTDSEVALKIVTAEAEGRKTPLRFRNEHRIGLMLGNHEQIVRPLCVGVLNSPSGFEGRMYLVTELVDGKPLDIIMAVHRHGLGVHRGCAIAHDIGRALASMHDRGIIHRDVKPGNVLVSSEGDTETAKLIDFGLAYVRGDEWGEPSHGQTREANVSGTALYMAPEQALGRCPAPSADIYAFGAVMYELFSGSPPHDRLPHAELLARKCDRTRPPISIGRMCTDLEPGLVDLVDRCLSYEPEDRPMVAEIVAALAKHLAPSVPQPVAEQRTTRPTGLVVALSVFSLVAAVAVVLLLLAWPERPPTSAGPPQSASPETPPQVPAMDASSSGAGAVPPSSATTSEPEEVPHPPLLDVDPSAEREPTKAIEPRRGERPGDPSAKADECSTAVDRAKRAAVQHKWGRVLRMTSSSTCWTGKAATQRARLRTQAYLELGRYSDCARAGRGLTDAQAVRWVGLCEAKSKG